MTRQSLRSIDRMGDRYLDEPDQTPEERYSEQQRELPPYERDNARDAWLLLQESLDALEGTDCSALHDVLGELIAAYAGNASPDQYNGWTTMTPEQRQVALDAWKMGNAAAEEDAR